MYFEVFKSEILYKLNTWSMFLIASVAFCQDFGAYIYIVPLIALLLMVRIASKRGLFYYRWQIHTIAFLSIFFLTAVFINIVLKKPQVWPEIYSLFISLILFFVVIATYSGKIEELALGVELAISLHVFLYLAQYFYYYSTGSFLDYAHFITGGPSRYLGEYGSMNIIRPVGFSFEPGSYSTYMTCLVAASYILRARLTWTTYVAIGSILSTFSVFGIIVSILIVLHQAFREDKKLILKALSIITLFSVFSYLYQDLLIQRFFNDEQDGSLRIKLWALYYLIDAPATRTLLGSGLAVNDCDCLYADNSMYFSLFYQFGILFALFFSYIIIKLRKYAALVLVLCIVMITKVQIFFPIFWLFLAVFVIRVRGSTAKSFVSC